ncbi:MAG: DUF2851 family protein [Lentisphaerae bacterium]|nr:DUF2851 family protein [Lentisphaerota bacterium]
MDLDRLFPLAAQYPAGPPAAMLLRERRPQPPVFPFTERHLQCVWADPAWRPATLHTSDGRMLRVETPGRWNLEAGPDFLEAVLRLGPHGRRLHGDVEIHVHPRGWLEHGHGGDPRYAHIAAHVTYFDAPLPPDALPPGTVRVALQRALQADPAFSFENIDVTAYPYACLRAARPPCAVAFAVLPPDRRAQVLAAAGHERLRIKADRLGAAAAARGADQALYEETFAALGYKHNSAPLRALARRVPYALLRDSCADALDAYTLLVGAAGLLPTRPSPRWDRATRTFVRRLWSIWWKRHAAGRHPAQAGNWRLDGLRPQNHPVRRLAAAALLFGPPTDLADRFAGIPLDKPGTAVAALQRLFAEVTTPGRDSGLAYWTHRLSFGRPPGPKPVALLGAPRRAAVVTNVVLPFLAVQGRTVTPLLDVLPAGQDNALLRETAHALFGRDHDPALYRDGIRRQGLLQIFHDFCLNNRNACRDCPLPAALRA